MSPRREAIHITPKKRMVFYKREKVYKPVYDWTCPCGATYTMLREDVRHTPGDSCGGCGRALLFDAPVE